MTVFFDGATPASPPSTTTISFISSSSSVTAAVNSSSSELPAIDATTEPAYEDGEFGTTTDFKDAEEEEEEEITEEISTTTSITPSVFTSSSTQVTRTTEKSFRDDAEEDEGETFTDATEETPEEEVTTVRKDEDAGDTNVTTTEEIEEVREVPPETCTRMTKGVRSSFFSSKNSASSVLSPTNWTFEVQNPFKSSLGPREFIFIALRVTTVDYRCKDRNKVGELRCEIYFVR